MSSRNLLNLVLLGTVLALIVIIVIEPGKTPEPTNPRLTTLKQDEINHIFIQRNTGKDIELEKINASWQMRKPYQLPANDFRMQSLLRLVEAESHSQNDLSKLDSKKFGLDKPRARITFNKQQTILFGNNEPLQQRRYVQTDNILHLIIDTFYYQLAARETTFIDHGLLAGKQDIVKLELPELLIEFKDGKWQTTPKNENISADAVTDLINQWRNTQAIEMREAKKHTSKKTAKVYFKDQEQPMIFSILDSKDETTLIRNDVGLEYVITIDNLKKLLSLTAASKDKAEDSSDSQ